MQASPARQSHVISFWTVTAVASAAALVAACGGGGGSGGSASPSASMLSGVAAYGAPMANASIEVIDAAGHKATATAGADGAYTAVVTDFSAPLLVRAVSTSGDTVKDYLSLVDKVPAAGQTQTANVTPLTHAVVAMVSADGGSPLELLNADKLKAVDAARIGNAVKQLQVSLADVLKDAGLAADFDPTKTAFKADRTSSADVLLDTIKVTVVDQGVNLLNARLPSDAAGTQSVAIKGLTSTPAVLGKPTVDASAIKSLDGFVAQANSCLALDPTKRVSQDSTTKAYVLQGACFDMPAFSTNYLNYGYTASQLWGNRLKNYIPANAKVGLPEFLKFTAADKAIVRLSYSSPDGAGSYIDMAALVDGKWVLIGNQRAYDASMSTRLMRATDVSTNGYTVPSSFTVNPDQGKNVGFFNSYTSRLAFSFNPLGPHGSDVYAIRVKGPGLPEAGIVLARSSACGTNDYMAFYRNDGVLPSPVLTTATGSSSTSWTLDAANFGTTYKGTDFYNQFRGLTSTGAPATNAGNAVAATPVDVSTIPEFAVYNWEVFTTTAGASNPDTFKIRMVTKPVKPSEGAKMPWATLNAASLDYVNPKIAGMADELDQATVAWTLPKNAPAVTSAYVFGTDGAVSMNAGENVKPLGGLSVIVKPSAEANGLNAACTYTKIPAYTETTGRREVGARQTTDQGLVLQQYHFHTGRKAS